MKSHALVAALALVSSFSFTASASVENVIVVPEKVFSPDGFDNNDKVEIVLHGHFPSTCYRAGPAKAKFERGQVIIRNTAVRDTASECLEMLVPWATTVTLGTLRSGSYPIFVESSIGERIAFDAINVTPARSRSLDDHLYGLINGALVNVDRTTKVPTLTVSGSFGISCMYLKSVEIVRGKKDIVNVLPIVELDRTKPCGYLFAPEPFQKTMTLNDPLETHSTLFYIRSMNGQAISRVVEY